MKNNFKTKFQKGRTGTYILIHTILSYAEEEGISDFNSLPLKDAVLKLREQRWGMIQTKVIIIIIISFFLSQTHFSQDQYVFGSNVIREYLSHK